MCEYSSRQIWASFIKMAGCSKDNSRARIILYAAIGVMMSKRKKQLLVKEKQIKRFWRRGIFKNRKLHSEYYNIYQNLRESDREWHYRYVRMSKERFDHLLGLVREKITKKDTQMRDAITAEERLVITLRYLSSGMSQQDLCNVLPSCSRGLIIIAKCEESARCPASLGRGRGSLGRQDPGHRNTP